MEPPPPAATTANPVPSVTKLIITHCELHPLTSSHPFQLENIDLVVADHMQRVMKPNFAASWDEIGEENQVEETFSLSSMKDIEGVALSVLCIHDILCTSMQA